MIIHECIHAYIYNIDMFDVCVVTYLRMCTYKYTYTFVCFMCQATQQVRFQPRLAHDMEKILPDVSRNDKPCSQGIVSPNISGT